MQDIKVGRGYGEMGERYKGTREEGEEANGIYETICRKQGDLQGRPGVKLKQSKQTLEIQDLNNWITISKQLSDYQTPNQVTHMHKIN